jgi:phospholipid/cholesterol/gamma-HCH transport system substrate-binding protein
MEKRWLEFSVGVFIIVGVACLGYLSFVLGNIGLNGSHYEVKAIFPTVSGLKSKAPVTMAGVSIGEVTKISLQDGRALVKMSIHKDIKLEEDVTASIKTAGIIGDKYISIAPGASDNYIKQGGTIRETQAPIDIEGLISRFVFGSIDKPKSAGAMEQPPGSEKLPEGSVSDELPDGFQVDQPEQQSAEE